MGNMTEQSIAYFFNGAAFMFFCCTCYIQLRVPNRSRIQTILGLILGYWAIWNLKDILYCMLPYHKEQMLDTIFFLDGWTAVSYAVLLFELSIPGWANWKKVAQLLVPFLLFTIIHLVAPSQTLNLVYWIFLLVFGTIIVVTAFIKVIKYQTYIHNNYINIENIDISWLKNIFIISILCQILWIADSLYVTSTGDSLYYLSSIIQWHLIIYYCHNHKSIVFPDKVELTKERAEAVRNEAMMGFPFAGRLEKLIEENEFYRKGDLTLQDLVQLVGSNRTYLSDYFNKVLNTTFYNYINKLRIEKISLPLLREQSELTIENIAFQSGFNSISTFRRAFYKETGMTPKEYRRNILHSMN
ncbi:helix-turn-helix domain-containing protein [uncultured Bacteroides sp.]|uniref:helix-turn-helix domain-containing protein n=1 Tax=uncultured Bacteroides sp. TaxID=162156 RepID=UPI0025E4743D|nr:helix-turn-helix domain-containing protein [uncultured Bacteroides sp.]